MKRGDCGFASDVSSTWLNFKGGKLTRYVQFHCIASSARSDSLQLCALLQKDCKVVQPPGKRVYQRGATSIWEVDGATAKVSEHTPTHSLELAANSLFSASFIVKIFVSSPNYLSSINTCSSM